MQYNTLYLRISSELILENNDKYNYIRRGGRAAEFWYLRQRCSAGCNPHMRNRAGVDAPPSLSLRRKHTFFAYHKLIYYIIKLITKLSVEISYNVCNTQCPVANGN